MYLVKLASTGPKTRVALDDPHCEGYVTELRAAREQTREQMRTRIRMYHVEHDTQMYR